MKTDREKSFICYHRVYIKNILLLDCCVTEFGRKVIFRVSVGGEEYYKSRENGKKN